MWWDEANRQWRAHPDCRCGNHDPCYCQGLRPLDRFGIPIDYPVLTKALSPEPEPVEEPEREDVCR
jgi:hypothetical protein